MKEQEVQSLPSNIESGDKLTTFYVWIGNKAY